MAVTFLEVDGIAKSFGGLMAVSDVSFTMKRDEIIGLIGPNGAGKTTLLRLITGLLKPDFGDVRFKGQSITRMKTWDIADHCQCHGAMFVSQGHETR
jgi:branched-chain amino acid transport system ATP-binding protein